MVNYYKSGANFERLVQKWYLDLGMYPVIRSSGSHGESDITAFFHGQIIFNSCRTNKKWSSAEKESFESMCKLNQAIGRYVWKGDKGEILFKEV